MALFTDVIFLSLTAFLGLFVVANSSSPGIIARFSNAGFQYIVFESLKSTLKRDVKVPDQSGSFSPAVGSVEYHLTEVVSKLTPNQVTTRINPGTGVTVSIGQMEASIRGKFSYKYTLMYIPTTSNSGNFVLTTSDVSLSVDMTVEMNVDDQPVVDFTNCSASVENIDLKLDASYRPTSFLNIFKGRLEDYLCDAIRNKRNLIEELLNNMKPCLDKACNFRIDLNFVSPLVFGENFIETSHRGELFWKNDTVSAPLEALLFQPLPPSSKMAELYVSSYVLNTALFTMYRSNLLNYMFTKDDLLYECQNALDTSCESNNSLCIGNIFPGEFASSPSASLELGLVTDSPPFISISNASLSIAFSIHANVSVINSDGIVVAMRQLLLRGSFLGFIFINPDALMDFNATDVTFENATFGDTELEIDRFKSEDSDAISRLKSIAIQCVLSKLIAYRQSSLSVTNIGGFHTTNRALKLIENAVAFTFDGFYSNGI